MLRDGVIVSGCRLRWLTVVVAGGLMLTVFVPIGRSSQTSSPTKTSWAAAANKLCAVANARVRKLPKANTLARIISDARALVKIVRAFVPRLAAIPRPPSERSAIRRILNTLRLETLNTERFIQAAEAGERAKAVRLAALAAKEDDEYSSALAALGANVCNEGPEPSG